MTFNPDTEHYIITSPYYVAMIDVKNEHVIEAAPIVKWMVGKRLDYILHYCKNKGFRIE